MPIVHFTTTPSQKSLDAVVPRKYHREHPYKAFKVYANPAQKYLNALRYKNTIFVFTSPELPDWIKDGYTNHEIVTVNDKTDSLWQTNIGWAAHDALTS